MKTAFILRGVTGSGKSFLAKHLARRLNGESFSTDDLFMDNGEYKFDPTKLGENHQINLEMFTKAAKAGVNAIICDNTNLLEWTFDKYIEVAQNNGYEIQVLSFPASSVEDHVSRSKHKVPRETVEAMINTYSEEVIIKGPDITYRDISWHTDHDFDNGIRNNLEIICLPIEAMA